MITVDIRGMDAIRAALQGVSSQLPFAIASAINSTAFSVMNAERAEIKRVFDRPTPWIVSQVRFTQATKQNLTAIVSFNTQKADAIMTPNVISGARGMKPYERVLQRIGVLPSGMRAIPALQLRTTASGDISRSAVNKIIRGVSAIGSGYFVIKAVGHRLHPGVWFKFKNGKIQPQFLFVPQATYRRRFDFTGVGEREVNRVFADNFEKALEKALATAS